MRSQKIKYNSFKERNCFSSNVVGVSCLLLLLLTFLAVNPIVGSPAFADEGSTSNEQSSDTTNNGGDSIMSIANATNTNSDIMTMADTTTPTTSIDSATSTVGISFSPAQYYASLSPTDSVGKSARIDITATVNVYNSGGYTVYLKSDSPNLVGVNNSSNFIPGATTAKTYTNMDVNTWGYAVEEDTTAVSDTATYKAIAISNDGDKLAENTNTKITTDTKTIALSFATKINNEKPADTYSNTMTLSAVSTPLQVTFTDYITDLQDMNPTICELVSPGAEAQLKDTRDNKYYWVAKLADNKCWMTQNLDLDLNESTTPLTPATSDVTADWTPGDAGKNPAYMENTATAATVYADDTGQRSWNLGSYYIKEPNGTTSCGTRKNSLADCTDYFTELATPTSANGNTNAHYLTGNYYQWCAATAGCKNSSGQTGSSFTSGETVSSICPKNWRLPTSDIGGEFQTLMNQYGITSGTATSGDTTNLVSSPLYFVRGGYISQRANLLAYAGVYSYYWSSTASSGNNSYVLTFPNTSDINPFYSNDRQVGFSVRCVAR